MFLFKDSIFVITWKLCPLINRCWQYCSRCWWIWTRTRAVSVLTKRKVHVLVFQNIWLFIYPILCSCYREASYGDVTLLSGGEAEEAPYKPAPSVCLLNLILLCPLGRKTSLKNQNSMKQHRMMNFLKYQTFLWVHVSNHVPNYFYLPLFMLCFRNFRLLFSFFLLITKHNISNEKIHSQAQED